MNYIINRSKISAFVIASAALIFSSCNKAPEEITAPSSGASTLTIGEFIATNPSYTILKAAVVKAGLLPLLSAKGNNLTVFAPNDIAMAASGFSLAAVTATPAASLKSLLQYHIMATGVSNIAIGTAFPNKQLPSILPLDPTNPYVMMNIFPSKNGGVTYVNNIPVKSVDQVLQNGVIHSAAGLVSPPSTVLAGLIYADPSLSYFKAAIARADVGQTGLNKFDSLLKYGVTNMTVLAPNDAAMKPIVIGSIYKGLLASLPQPVSPSDNATALATANTLGSTAAGINYLPVADVRGIVAYHILASKASGAFTPDIRVFSVNFKTVPTFVNTLVNSSIAEHPGIMAKATFTGSAVSSLTFTGYGTGVTPFVPFSGAAANAVTMDKHAVNGVLHIIDKALLPQ